MQRLFEASVNTLNNSAQETVVDGMARERQQYSGDGAHQLHAIYHGFGETRLSARFINTFSMGLTHEGYFLDCWPAFDRLARLMERQLNLTGWGPIVDHGIGFCFDSWYFYQYTGSADIIKGVFPRLIKFFNWLQTITDEDGLLKVEELGVPSVWIDHVAYKNKGTSNVLSTFMLRLCACMPLPHCQEFLEKTPGLKKLKLLEMGY
ncbi:MAG: hypothetical protein HC830_00045 [Bacteroidetes bacterium]|nr:hypothetical protein [Bacteroidota bacterium]